MKIADKRIQELIFNKKVPKSVADDAIFCYYQTLKIAHQKSLTLCISLETIQELYFQVMHFYTSDSGIHINNYNSHPLPYEPIQLTLLIHYTRIKRYFHSY